MKSFLSKFLNYHGIIFFISLYFVIFYHNSFWQTLLETTKNFDHRFFLFFSIGGILCFLLAFVFEILCSFFTYRYILAIFVLLGAFSAYYMDTYKISLNPMIIDSILHTNFREAKDFIHPMVFIKIFLLLALPYFFIFFIKISPSLLKTKLYLLFFYLFIILALFFSNEKNIIFAFKAYKPTIDMLNPIAPIRSTIRHFSTIYQTPKSYMHIGLDANLKPNDQAKIIVLVIGESARAKNFEYNGYNRATNPYTKTFAKNLINFEKFKSCGVITAISIPCMLTNLTHQNYTARNLSYYQDNILDIAKRVGYEVWWISNNGGECMGKVCQRLESDHISYYPDHILDGDMLPQIHSLIKNAQKNTFLVINLHGSHGAKYFERYPQNFSFFTPVCKDENLQNCSTNSLFNAYDNSLRYTDFVIAEILKVLTTSPLPHLLWYVSDHGESLGEYNQYMHGGLPYALAPKEQTHIPSYIYLGKGFASYYKSLQSQQKNTLSHDFVFHTLLHFLNIQTKDYVNTLDLANNTK
ncbi:phosphoethanolamine transferase [Helicobacter anatolicus]|uniref:phosphoethanolamine transferase n=1 Tax=Helicobacter anatolicus TaxID=2905874 RepID=UPI001E5566D8|nr:sulfatase-like hydrolase/transferase [Helicobacter anatolicus]